MNIHSPEVEHAGLSPRVALFSIAGFWAFYFAIVTVRAAVLGIEGQVGMLGFRAIVTVVSILVTLLFYLGLRRTSAARLGRTILVAALLALPSAVIYSTTNYYAFLNYDRAMMAKEKRKTVVVTTRDDRNGGVTVSVGGSHEDDMEKSAFMAIADNAANGYFFFVAWAALYLALSYAAQAIAAERRAAAFRAAAQSAELRALRYQVNPHFLFNTLNSLSSLVMTGKAQAAEQMIQNLATFFRTSLSGDPTEDVDLYEEIRFERLYLDIETVRFPDRLKAEFHIPDPLRTACVPGLILQPLVENAIKYGVSRARRPVTIRIVAREDSDGLVLSVEDDGDSYRGMPHHASETPARDPEREDGDPPRQPPESASTGVGLKNVRDRLAARFGDAGQCRWGPLPGGGFRVMLFMPLVRNGC